MILDNNLPLRILARFSSTISWFRNMFKQIAGPCVIGHLVIGCSFGYTNNESQLQRKFRTFVEHVNFLRQFEIKILEIASVIKREGLENLNIVTLSFFVAILSSRWTKFANGFYFCHNSAKLHQ
jgi:hypothetical protein